MKTGQRTIIILILILLVYYNPAKGNIDLELRLASSWQHIEVNITKDSQDGYVSKSLSYGGSLILIASKLQFALSYERFSWNRDFVGQMVGLPDPSPIEEIHETVTSNTYSFELSHRWIHVSKLFIPSLGCGIKLNCLAGKKVGQTTGIRQTADRFWYPGLSFLGGLTLPITDHFEVSCEIDACAMGASSFLQVEDGYKPARNLLKVSSISLGIGYRF
jgi:hypothetical protein